ncbi:MAG TPA: hypothetical protein VFP80_05625 [Thermoanaerobaculia bacterium]|nr:hypothetical protein [Thermoanaerobaculia bacterium]
MIEIVGPEHAPSPDVPFVVTVVAANAPDGVVRELESHFMRAAAPSGFGPLDAWPTAIDYSGSDAVRQVGQTQFGLYTSPLRKSVAWQTKLMLVGSSACKVVAKPSFNSIPKSTSLMMSLNSHWSPSLNRAIALASLVIICALLLVAQSIILRALLGGVALPIMWQVIPDDLIALPYLDVVWLREWRWLAPEMLAGILLVSMLSKKPLLDWLLPARESGAVNGSKREDETSRDIEVSTSNDTNVAKTPLEKVEKAASDVSIAKPVEEAKKSDSGVGDGRESLATHEKKEPTVETPAEKPVENKREPGWRGALVGLRRFWTFVGGPVSLAYLRKRYKAARPSEPKRESVERSCAPAQARTDALRVYKDVADDMVSTMERRAQWQLVMGGASGLAAVVFLLSSSVAFGDMATRAPRGDESALPLIIHMFPYVLCFASLLLAAAFLLRQYRTSLDDFRHFVRNQRLRESQSVALSAARRIQDRDDVARKTIEILAWGESSSGKAREPFGREGGGPDSSDPSI